MPIFSIPQGPDYMGAGRQIAATIGAEAKPWDIAEHVATIRTMAEKLAEDQQLFPIKLATAQMQSRMIQNEVRSYEIEHSPERVLAAADLKKQEDQLRVEGMTRKKDEISAVDEFYKDYGGDLEELRLTKDPKKASAILSSINANSKYATSKQYILPEFDKYLSGLPDPQRQKAINDVISGIHTESVLQEKGQKIKAKLADEEAATNAVGQSLGNVMLSKNENMTKAVQSFATTMLAKKDLTAKQKTVYQNLFDNPNITTRDATKFLQSEREGSIGGALAVVVAKVSHPLASMSKGSIVEVDQSQLEAEAIKMQMAQMARMIEDPKTRQDGKRMLREYIVRHLNRPRLSDMVDPALENELMDFNAEARAYEIEKAARQLGQFEGMTEYQQQQIAIQQTRNATRGGASGYRKTYENDAMGKRISETKTPLGGGATAPSAAVSMRSPSGKVGVIPETEVDAALAKGFTLL